MPSSYYALLCEVDRTKESLRHHVRGDHLAFLDARKSRIHFGGPLIGPDGAPETMLIVLAADDAWDASRFMSDEPYNRCGVFKRITVMPWVQVLPESHRGALDEAIAMERASSSQEPHEGEKCPLPSGRRAAVALGPGTTGRTHRS